MMSSLCLSAPMRSLEVNRTRSKRTVSSQYVQKCLATCLEGKSSQICFGEGIHDARPAPVLPDHICKSTRCLPSTETCPTNVTTFPFRYMLTRGSLRRSDTNNVSSICGVPVENMAACAFRPTPESTTDFSHGQEVMFVTRRRDSTDFKSKTCVCYDGQWISRNAIYGTTNTKKNSFLCNVHNSQKLKYLRTKRVMQPTTFTEESLFVRIITEEFKRLWTQHTLKIYFFYKEERVWPPSQNSAQYERVVEL